MIMVEKKKRWALLAECEKTSFVLNLDHILSKKLNNILYLLNCCKKQRLNVVKKKRERECILKFDRTLLKKFPWICLDSIVLPERPQS